LDAVTFYCQGQTSGAKDESIRFEEGKKKPFKGSKNQSEQRFFLLDVKRRRQKIQKQS